MNGATERILSAWSVHALLFSRRITIIPVKRKSNDSASTLYHRHEREEGRIVVYRAYFLRLLACPKPLRDQLLIELPVKEALRSGEVASLRAEYVDFERGDLRVLDSKKYRLFTIPLDPVVAEHLAEYLRKRGTKEGLVFIPETRRGRPRTQHSPKSQAFGETYLEWVWRKWCKACGIPYMSPRYGRAYFACEWCMGARKKSLKALQMILRHDNVATTEAYLDKIVDYADVKAEFNEGLKSPFVSECARKDCPLRVSDCHCRMFTPKIEVKS